MKLTEWTGSMRGYHNKLIKILGRKIYYGYLDDFLASPGDLDSDKLRLEKNDIFFRLDYNLNKDQEKKIYQLISETAPPKTITLDLANDIILPWPWKKERLVRTFINIGKDKPAGEWKQDESNHKIIYCDPIGVGLVYGGNHSLSTGIIDGVGRVSVTAFLDLDLAYKSIHCDGDFYYFEGNKISKVNNVEFAIIFELGRILNSYGVKSKDVLHKD